MPPSAASVARLVTRFFEVFLKADGKLLRLRAVVPDGKRLRVELEGKASDARVKRLLARCLDALPREVPEAKRFEIRPEFPAPSKQPAMTEAVGRASKFLDAYSEQHDHWWSKTHDDLGLLFSSTHPHETVREGMWVWFTHGDHEKPKGPRIQKLVRQCMEALLAAHPELSAFRFVVSFTSDPTRGVQFKP